MPGLVADIKAESNTMSESEAVLVVKSKYYDPWIRKFPNIATIPFIIGSRLCRVELPQARSYLLKAIELDPKMVNAYYTLYLDAERWGDRTVAANYMKKAAEIKPDVADYLYLYGLTFKGIDYEKYRDVMFEVARRFPKDERGAQGLYWVAFGTDVYAEKVKIYEQIRKNYPAKFLWKREAMGLYLYQLIKKDPVEALKLAKEMYAEVQSDNHKKQWNENIQFAEKVLKIQELLKEGKPKEAKQAVIGLPKVWEVAAQATILLLTARVEAACGNTAAAYDSLISFYEKKPASEIMYDISKYGSDLGKSKEQIEADIWKRRNLSAKKASDFTLKNYMNGRKVSLSNFKGKTVLLTFWFPGCGPCRGEFPLFQKIIGELKSQGKEIVFIAINILTEQDEYVVPFVKSMGANPFLPLSGGYEWSKKTYGIGPVPANYLIDSNGRIVFSKFIVQGSYDEHVFRNMINEVLNRNSKN